MLLKCAMKSLENSRKNEIEDDTKSSASLTPPPLLTPFVANMANPAVGARCPCSVRGGACMVAVLVLKIVSYLLLPT